MTKPSLMQLRSLVGNPNAYALQHEDGGWHPVREPLDDKVLRRHLARELTVGTYVNHGDKARTLVFDIDDGDKGATDRIVQALYDLGVMRSAVGVEFSGKKGYHVWCVLKEYAPAAGLRRVGRAVCAMAGWEGEVNPKQDEARDLGNLVKLPGGIHQVSKAANDFIGRVPVPMPSAAWANVIATLPPEVAARRSGPSDVRFPCIGTICEGVAEGGRNRALFQLATLLRRNGMPDELVELSVNHVNEKFDPPLDGQEVEAVLDSSNSSGPICQQLPESLQCGALCIRERTAGLYSRPGQLRHAGVGEMVVVEIESHTGSQVAFNHNDLENAAKGRVKEKT